MVILRRYPISMYLLNTNVTATDFSPSHSSSSISRVHGSHLELVPYTSCQLSDVHNISGITFVNVSTTLFISLENAL